MLFVAVNYILEITTLLSVLFLEFNMIITAAYIVNKEITTLVFIIFSQLNSIIIDVLQREITFLFIRSLLDA